MTPEGIKLGNYIGPKTHLLTRLRKRDLGVSDVDRVAKVHDILFTLAENPKDVREADMRMLKGLKMIRKRGSDYDVNISTAESAIEKKILGEKLGILSQGSFSGMRGKDLNDEDRKILMENLEKMTQLGYGADANRSNRNGATRSITHKPRALYGNEIEYIMRDDPDFIGVYAKNELPKLKINKSRNSCLIYNLHDSNQEGSHWCAINYDTRNGYIENFDSFGMKPCKDSINFMKKYKKPIKYNKYQIQKNDSVLCGFYCIEYLLNRNEKQPKEIFNNFTKRPSIYNELKVLNDNF